MFDSQFFGLPLKITYIFLSLIEHYLTSCGGSVINRDSHHKNRLINKIPFTITNGKTNTGIQKGPLTIDSISVKRGYNDVNL